MAEEITRLDSPIDVMYLIHKAFRTLSDRVESEISQVVEGGDLQPFKEGFDLWTKLLLYHATAEDKYMTAPLTHCRPARDNEAEHEELALRAGALAAFIDKGDAAGLEASVKAAMLTLEDQQHKELAGKLRDVEDVLKSELGESRVVARTRRQLYKRVVDLRIFEFDHFENEEAFVLPVVRERMTEAEELEVVRHLLMDEESDEPRWIIDWVGSDLTTGEQMLLGGLELRLRRVTATST